MSVWSVAYFSIPWRYRRKKKAACLLLIVEEGMENGLIKLNFACIWFKKTWLDPGKKFKMDHLIVKLAFKGDTLH